MLHTRRWAEHGVISGPFLPLVSDPPAQVNHHSRNFVQGICVRSIAEQLFANDVMGQVTVWAYPWSAVGAPGRHRAFEHRVVSQDRRKGCEVAATHPPAHLLMH